MKILIEVPKELESLVTNYGGLKFSVPKIEYFRKKLKELNITENERKQLGKLGNIEVQTARQGESIYVKILQFWADGEVPNAPIK